MGYGLHVLEIIFGLPVGAGETSVLKFTQPGSELKRPAVLRVLGTALEPEADRINPCRFDAKMVGVPKLRYFECLPIINRDNLPTLYGSKIYICVKFVTAGGEGAEKLILLELQLLRVSIAPEDVRTLDFR